MFIASDKVRITCTPISSPSAGLNPSKYLATCCPFDSRRLFLLTYLINCAIYSCTDHCPVDNVDTVETKFAHNLGVKTPSSINTSSYTKFVQDLCLLVLYWTESIPTMPILPFQMARHQTDSFLWRSLHIIEESVYFYNLI